MPPGVAYTAVAEGTRSFLVEVQALTVPAKSGFSRIFSDRIDSARVTRIAAVLERHAGLRLSDQDIYVNVGGGMKVGRSPSNWLLLSPCIRRLPGRVCQRIW